MGAARISNVQRLRGLTMWEKARLVLLGNCLQSRAEATSHAWRSRGERGGGGRQGSRGCSGRGMVGEGAAVTGSSGRRRCCAAGSCNAVDGCNRWHSIATSTIATTIAAVARSDTRLWVRGSDAPCQRIGGQGAAADDTGEIHGLLLGALAPGVGRAVENLLHTPATVGQVTRMLLCGLLV